MTHGLGQCWMMLALQRANHGRPLHPILLCRPSPQVLNALAPVQMHTDPSGANNMLVSSATLAKSIGDLPSQIDALAGLNDILKQCVSSPSSFIHSY